MTARIRTYYEIEGGSADLGDQVASQAARVSARLASIGRVVAIMSGKGGVGKSLVTGLLAAALARTGRRVGVIDADLNGPSLARMLGVEPESLVTTADGVEPTRGPGDIALMSMALLVKDDAALDWHEPEEAGFVWRGTQERGALREFLSDVRWGVLDVLFLDLPPGTQRLVDLHEMVPDLSGAIAVTIPSAASRDSVSRSLELCVRRGIPLLGLIENFAGIRCASCGEIGPLHAGDAGSTLGETFKTPLLARLPHDPELGLAAERGTIFTWLAGGTEAAKQIVDLADHVAGVLERGGTEGAGT